MIQVPVQATNREAPVAPPAQGTPQVAQLDRSQAHAAYQGAVAARDELLTQIATLQSTRTSIAGRLRDGGAAPGPDLDGLTSRIALLDKQLNGMYEQLAVARNAVVVASAVPGAVSSPAFGPNGPPEGALALGALFICVVMLPISIAVARRIWRRSSAAVTSLPKELMERLNRIEESVDSVAIEVERVGEGQRFVTNLFIESGAPHLLGAGAMEPLDVKQGERVEQERRPS
jgi:hypothetical protein